MITTARDVSADGTVIVGSEFVIERGRGVSVDRGDRDGGAGRFTGEEVRRR